LQSGLCNNASQNLAFREPRGPGASKAQPPRVLVGHCTSDRPLNPTLGPPHRLEFRSTAIRLPFDRATTTSQHASKNNDMLIFTAVRNHGTGRRPASVCPSDSWRYHRTFFSSCCEIIL